MRAAPGLAALVIVACSTTTTTTMAAPSTTATVASTTTAPAETTTTSPSPVIGTLPDGPCELGSPPPKGEVTFVVGDRLFGAGPEGGSVRCLLLVDEEIRSLLWSPTGERVFVNGRIYPEDPSIAPVPGIGQWTRPTGQGVLSLEGSKLLKYKDGEVLDVSFLADHVATSYHPAGTHIASIGTHEDGRYGLWLATNTGEDPVLLAADEEAVLTEVDFDAAGGPVFVAHHSDDDVWHLHRLLISGDEVIDQLLLETATPVGGLAASPFLESLVAYRIGGDLTSPCARGGTVEVLGVSDPGPGSVEQGTATGWLPNDQLLLLRYQRDCFSADLWVLSTGLCPDAPYGLTLLAGDVAAAAARVVYPPPPPSPGSGVIDSTAPA